MTGNQSVQRFSRRNENTEIRASSSEKDKTQPNPEQDIPKTQRNGHLNANQSKEKSDTQGLTEEQNSSDQRTSHVLAESAMMPELGCDILKVRHLYLQEF